MFIYGIFGYIGDKPAKTFLLDGLKALEYRGYDSAGITVLEKGDVCVLKRKGKIEVLRNATEGKLSEGIVGIGHTRWATHGEPSDANSHPHQSEDGRFAVVHNGIIENYLSLKQSLMNEGVVFHSQTDTEVVAALLQKNFSGDMLDVIKKTTAAHSGSYALAILCADYPNKVFATSKDSPLILGKGDNQNFVSSDITAILPYSKNALRLDGHEIAAITATGFLIYDQNLQPVEREFSAIDWESQASALGNYDSFMLKEIDEIPAALKATISRLPMDGYKTYEKLFKAIDKVIIVACGTAYHAGYVGKYLIEHLARISVNIEIASEFRYDNPIVDSGTLCVVISQSGETADTIAALKEAKSKGATILAITNVKGCTINSLSDFVLPTTAGPEIAVASTKAYNCQLMVLYYLANLLRFVKGRCDLAEYESFYNKLLEVCPLATYNQNELKALAYGFREQKSIFYLGRGLDFCLAMEGSLKLKEISYIHSEAYAMGELKHGTLALIENGTLVIANLTQKALLDKSINGLAEVKARGAKVIAVIPSDFDQHSEYIDYSLQIAKVDDIFAPLIAIVPAQIFAYHMARTRGVDPDKPRNLAKSVTVE